MKNRIFFIPLIFAQCVLFSADASDAVQLDSIMRKTAEQRIENANKKDSYRAELERLESLKNSYEIFCRENLKKLHDEESSAEQSEKVLGDLKARLGSDKAYFDDFKNWLSYQYEDLFSNALFAKLLEREGIDKTPPEDLLESYVQLGRALKILKAENSKLNLKDGKFASGLCVVASGNQNENFAEVKEAEGVNKK